MFLLGIFGILGIIHSEKIDLNGIWKVYNSSSSESEFPITIPGTVQYSLKDIYGDLFWRYNDVKLRWISKTNWLLKRTFIYSSLERNGYLVFEGVDTIADIYFNNQKIGKVENSFTSYVFPIKINNGENTIILEFTNPVSYANMKNNSYPYEVPGDTSITIDMYKGEYNRQFIRKPQSHFGWDWGLCALPIGIHRNVYILIDNLIRDISIDITYDKAFIVNSTIELFTKSSGNFKVTIENKSISKKFINQKFISLILTIHDPKLWYPRGYGEQNLYNLVAEIYNNNNKEIINRKIGFRRVKIIEDSGLPNGNSFYISVNEIPIFAKGANVVPIDVLVDKINNNVLEKFIKSLYLANMNTIRIWGGGEFIQDKFYELCDEYGIMIMHDLMFACSLYPRDENFLNSVKNEIFRNVFHLMYHSSIISWAGNNENEALLYNWPGKWQLNKPLYLSDYTILYLSTIQEVITKLDTSRPYFSSSPSNGILSKENPLVFRWGNPGNGNQGDVHYYNYGADCLDTSLFPLTRFASEYGYQSIDSMYSWNKISNPEDLTINGDFLNHRQHHPDGNQQIIIQIKQHFRWNNPSFDSFSYLSQVVQALCIQQETEHYRRHMSDEVNTMGALYWQANNVWTAPSWSSIEYQNMRWKLLHYFAKDFFEPFLISPVIKDFNTLEIFAINELPNSIKGKINISLMNWFGEKLFNESHNYQINSLKSENILNLNIPKLMKNGNCLTRDECFILIESDKSKRRIVPLDEYANVATPDPQLFITNQKQISSNEINFEINSKEIAQFVYLESPLEGYFSENGFIMLKNEKKLISFIGWKLINLKDFNLKFRSIYDTT